MASSQLHAVPGCFQLSKPLCCSKQSAVLASCRAPQFRSRTIPCVRVKPQALGVDVYIRTVARSYRLSAAQFRNTCSLVQSLVQENLNLVPESTTEACSQPPQAAKFPLQTQQAHLPRASQTDTLPRARSPPSWLHKLIPLGLMYMAACFTNTIVDMLKDAVVVTSCGAEVLPYLSALFVLPASLALCFFHSWLNAKLPRKLVFHATLVPFLVFYIVFATILYPNHAALHVNLCSGSLYSALPAGLKPLFALASNWTFALFFTAAELWGPVAISLSFFGTANDVLTIDEAAVVYPLVGIIANVAVIAAGLFSSCVLKSVAQSNMQLSVNYLIGSCVVATAVMSSCKLLLDRVSGERQAAEPGATCVGQAPARAASGTRSTNKPKSTLGKRHSFRSAFSAVTSSRHVYNLFLFVASYGLCHKLFEVSWKDQLRSVFPAASEYQSVLSNVQTAVGVTTLALMVVARFVFSQLGWTVAAVSTPIMMLLCGSAFFGLSVASQGSQGLSWLPLQPGGLARAGAMAGNVAEVASRSMRYSLLEPAKEMKYMELSTEQRAQAKAAVDVMASTLGKSGASWLIQMLVFARGSLSAALPVVGVLFAGIILAWVGSIQKLGKGEEVPAATDPARELVLATA